MTRDMRPVAKILIVDDEWQSDVMTAVQRRLVKENWESHVVQIEQSWSAGSALASDAKGTAGTVSLGSFSVDSFILALQNVATLRAENGATSSRLKFASDQLEAAKVNMEAARSRIVDTDVAQESTAFARYSILVQAGAAMLSQANNTQASVMQMLLL